VPEPVYWAIKVLVYVTTPRKKHMNINAVSPAGVAAAIASTEYHPRNMRSVNSITVVEAMLATRGRLILNTALYPWGLFQRFNINKLF
jgi:hypothetical protein